MIRKIAVQNGMVIILSAITMMMMTHVSAALVPSNIAVNSHVQNSGVTFDTCPSSPPSQSVIVTAGDNVRVCVDLTLSVNFTGAIVTYGFWNITFYQINTNNTSVYSPSGTLQVSGTPGSDHDMENYLYTSVQKGDTITVDVSIDVHCYGGSPLVELANGSSFTTFTINCI